MTKPSKPRPATGAGHELGSFPEAGVAVVFGASGGIGRALVEAIWAAEQFDHVVALGRGASPAIDLLDEASLQRGTAFAADKGELRLVIDATGFLHDERQRPEKSWRQLDAVNLARSFALNAIGPALIMKHVLPLLPRSGKAVFATLSARVGSIGDNRLGGWYSYRASKAALNQLVRTAAIELARRSPDALCVALHPGTVATALSAPFSTTGWKFVLRRRRPAICSPSSTSSRQKPTAGSSTGAANPCLGDRMAKMRRKADLPTKICSSCGRPLVWRKKWARDWANVKYCSERCRAAPPRPASAPRVARS